MILPQGLRQFLDETGDISRFVGRFFSEGFKPRYEFGELIRQSFYIGYKSLPLVGVTAFIMGLVLTIQSRPTLVEFGAESWLPAMVSVSLVREISPMITALIASGKIGSSIGAELGSMKVTEQIDAMEVSGTNPFKYLVVTRVLAANDLCELLSSTDGLISRWRETGLGFERLDHCFGSCLFRLLMSRCGPEDSLFTSVLVLSLKKESSRVTADLLRLLSGFC